MTACVMAHPAMILTVVLAAGTAVVRSAARLVIRLCATTRQARVTPAVRVGRLAVIFVILVLSRAANVRLSAAPPIIDYCQRLQQDVQGRRHGFLAGNTSYYIGGFHASWQVVEHETIGLTHPFHHDLRSRGVGRVQSRGQGADNTGLGHDFTGWEFYKDTRVLYGSVIVNGVVHRHPAPLRMWWRPDRMVCEYEVDGVRLREEKFITRSDVVCSLITSSEPVTLRFQGHSFFGRHSETSTARSEFVAEYQAICLTEGGTTRCRPDSDRRQRLGPIMYEGMTTVLSASQNFANSLQLSVRDNNQQAYQFELAVDDSGVAVVWAMDDDRDAALARAAAVTAAPRAARDAKTQHMNELLSRQIPYFRCSDERHTDIYYYLWSLYLMYDIDVQSGWETVPHTQTAVNNFLGMHRYDATFQIRTGSWVADKTRYACGNVLTWKPLVEQGHYRRSDDGVIALPDNKGTTWHSGVYGLELSEHVPGAWQIYEHTGDMSFLRACYDDYFRVVFYDRIPPFFSNHFEVAQVLAQMADLLGYPDDVTHWQSLVPQDAASRRRWFDQRWQVHGHRNYFAGPADGMLMTTGFWHLRSPFFPREYATAMVQEWAENRDDGFYGEFFPLAMSRQAMRTFHTPVDHAFGYTPDTAYFTLSGLFRQQQRSVAARLTLDHLEHYNYHDEWQMPIAPEACRRDGRLFGDQYSNFNAGKILLYLEGFSGLEYSLPQGRLVVRDNMPPAWDWMEIRVPMAGRPASGLDEGNAGREATRTLWPRIRWERATAEDHIIRTITVEDCPLTTTIEPWTEGRRVLQRRKRQSDDGGHTWLKLAAAGRR